MSCNHCLQSFARVAEKYAWRPLKQEVLFVAPSKMRLIMLSSSYICIFRTELTPFLKEQHFLTAALLDCVRTCCPFSPTDCMFVQTCTPQGKNSWHVCYFGGFPALPCCVGSQAAAPRLSICSVSPLLYYVNCAASSFSNCFAPCCLNSICCVHEILWCSFLFLPPLLCFSILWSLFSLCFLCHVLCGSVIACPREKSQ